MSKRFYLQKRNNVYYVRFRNLIDNSLTTAKSTGKTVKEDAEMVAMTWLVNGDIPDDIRVKKQTLTLAQRNFLKAAKKILINDKFKKQLVDILTSRGLFDYVVLSNKDSLTVIQYLDNFWDYDKSQYIKDKLHSNQQIHFTHCNDSRRIINSYYKEFFKDRTLASIRLEDMKQFKNYLIDKELSGSRVNNILRAGLTGLKYAFHEGKLQNNCFDGLIMCGNTSEERKILTLEQAEKVFSVHWSNYKARLANHIAYTTGMRLGEIRALRIEDVQNDRLLVRHSFNKKEGLKCCKNGEERVVPLLPEIKAEIDKLIAENPFGNDSYLFYGLSKDKPTDAKHWLLGLRNVLRGIGVADAEDITFHAWRHLYITELSHSLSTRMIQKVSGHKTEKMVAHYSDHVQEKDFAMIKEQVRKTFGVK